MLTRGQDCRRLRNVYTTRYKSPPAGENSLHAARQIPRPLPTVMSSLPKVPIHRERTRTASRSIEQQAAKEVQAVLPTPRMQFFHTNQIALNTEARFWGPGLEPGPP